MVSSGLTDALLVATAGFTGLLIAGVVLAARRLAGSGQPAGQVAPLAVVAVLAWASVSVLLAKHGEFASHPRSMVPGIVAGIAAPLAIGIGLLSLPAVRRLVGAVPIAWLTGVQLYRVIGGLFLVAWGQHLMPGAFALPAGIGDVAVGLLAPVAAWWLATDRPGARRVAQAWNLLGLADLVVAVSMGFLTSPSPLQQLAHHAPNLAISRYPFVLVPVYLVPASILLHIAGLRRLAKPAPARNWTPASSAVSATAPSRAAWALADRPVRHAR